MPDTATTASFVTGFTLGLTLIIAIGAQNAYVLRQGLRREHVGAVVAGCALLDVALMAAGVGGLGALVGDRPRWLQAAGIAGAVALAWYGYAAFRRALRPHALAAATSSGPATATRALVEVLGISLLNPHVYLDTVVLVGTVGARQAAGTQGVFWLGSSLASCLWFAGLGYGARVLSPLFAQPLAWRVLDAVIGVTMWAIALKLALGAAG